MDINEELDPPLGLSAAQNETRSFRTLRELIAWADQEKDFWVQLNNSMKRSSNPFRADFFLSDHIGAAQTLQSAAQNLVRPNPGDISHLQAQLESALDQYGRQKFILSTTSAARRAAEFAQKDPNAAWTWLAILHGKHRGDAQKLDLPKNTDILGLVSGIFDVIFKTQEFDPSECLKGFDEASAELKSRWEKRFEQSATAIKGLEAKATEVHDASIRQLSEQLNAHQELLKAHGEELSKLRTSYSVEMQLGAANNYWENKRKTNAERAKFAAWKFYGILGGGLIVVGGIWCFLFQQGFGQPAQLNLIQGLLFAGPLIPYLWLLRMFATERKVNLRMSDDAEERQAMVMTFRALESQGQASEKERILILAALFRAFASDGDDPIPLGALETFVNRKA